MSAAAEWQAMAMPAMLVPDAIGPALAEQVRARLERAGYTRYALLDRGSYDYVTSPDEPELLVALATIAAEITGRSLVVEESRALRLRSSDYLLVRHDRVYADRPVELVLDLSPASVPGAAVHYRHRGQVFFVAPSMPGALTVVSRGPTVMCNHTYVSKLHRDACVVRIVALLRDAPRREIG